MSEKAPKTIEDLKRLSVQPPGPHALQQWIFLEGAAKGRLAVAERRMREIENHTFVVLNKSWGFDVETARQLVMQHAPDDIQIHKAEVALADATEEVSICGRMIEHLRNQKEKPNANAQNETPQRRPARNEGSPAHGQNARGVPVRSHSVAAVAGGARPGGGVHPAPAANDRPGRG